MVEGRRGRIRSTSEIHIVREPEYIISKLKEESKIDKIGHHETGIIIIIKLEQNQLHPEMLSRPGSGWG